MEITNIGHFTRYEGPDDGFMFFRNEDGHDWYDIQRGIVTWGPSGAFVSSVYGAWAAVDATGIITHVERDPSRIVPDNKTVLGIDTDPEDIQAGMLYQNGEIVPAPTPPEPTPEELRAAMPNISGRQLWLAAKSINITKADVLAMVTVAMMTHLVLGVQ